MEKSTYESEYDIYFDKNSFINFYPFVGKKYSKCSSKLLVLGESHYLHPETTNEEQKEADNNKQSTRIVFNDEYLDGIQENGSHPYKYIRCYRNTAAMITGKDYHCSDYVWDKLSFYNFFQKYIGRGAKEKDSVNEILIQDSRKAYEEVLKILKPKLVIAWGRGSLYYEWVPQDDREFIDESLFLYKYNNFPNTAFWHIRHPSQGFSYTDYHEEFLKVLSAINLDISCILKA